MTSIIKKATTSVVASLLYKNWATEIFYINLDRSIYMVSIESIEKRLWEVAEDMKWNKVIVKLTLNNQFLDEKMKVKWMKKQREKNLHKDLSQ